MKKPRIRVRNHLAVEAFLHRKGGPCKNRKDKRRTRQSWKEQEKEDWEEEKEEER
jgi:hypothetical protein